MRFPVVRAVVLALVPSLLGAAPVLQLKRGPFDPQKGSRAAPAWFQEIATAASPSGFRYLMIATRRPLDAEDRVALEAAGARLLDYVPVNGYRIRIAPEGEAAVRRLPFVAWAGTLPGYAKIDPSLDAASDGASETPVRVIVAAGEPITRVTDVLSGLAFDAAPAGQDGAWRVTVRLPAARAAAVLSTLASLAEVEAVEPARRFLPFNQDAVWVHQSFVGPSPQQTPIFDRGIFGCGQIVGVADTAQDYDACYFRDTVNGAPPIATCSAPPCPAATPAPNRRKDILYYNWSGGIVGEQDTCPATITGTSGHGTHTSGSIAGDTSPYADCTAFSTPSRNGGDGAAPGAKLVVQELGDGLEYLNTLGGTMWNLLDVAYQGGARIHANSWGGACYDELGNCLPGCTMPYDSYARDADLAMWTYPDLLVVTAAGNAGWFCPAPIAVGTPANAKSTVTVGATSHGANASTPASFTSQGPVEDGRLKPAVAAQGEATVSAASDANLGTNNCSTCSLDGSSMSAPTAAGLAALVREYYAAGYYAAGTRSPAQGLTPTGSLIKATLLDGAEPLGIEAPGPDFDSGYGRIQLDRTLAFAGGTRRLRVDDRREGLVTGGLVEHAYDVAAGMPLRATLVWSDYPASLLAAVARVNELKLEVVDPSGTVWFQTLDGASGLPRATSNQAEPHDTRNVEERLVFSNPAPGRWIVRVRGAAVPWGPQPFALVVTGAITDCPAPAAPAVPSLTTPADRQVLVSWSAVPGAVAYDVHRALGACPGEGFVPIASAVAGTSFLDTTVSGGATYSYVVTATSDAAGACESPRSPCASIVPTGDCVLAPSFRGIASAASTGAPTCTVGLAWDPATARCAGDVRYNVYRGTTGGFVPSASNRIARCLVGTTFDDSVDLLHGQTRWYVVRAEDVTSGHGGPCRGGNEETNAVAVAAAPDGPPAVGTWSDDAGDTGTPKLVPTPPWIRAASGGCTGPNVYAAASGYGVCADLTTPTLTLADPGQGPQVMFKTKHDLDYDPTGEIFGTEGSLGQVEIATGPSFSNWNRVLLTPDYPNPVEFPYNLCPTTQALTRYFTGIDLACKTYTGSLVNWAGGDVKLRFHLSGDLLYTGGNWWIDDVSVTRALVPGSCATAGAGPPPVPDGGPVPGVPLRASRSGGNVSVTWDASQCPATAINLYYGALGSFATFAGGRCGLAPTGAATISLPANVWFLAAATDGIATDGSYGRTLTGAERSYSGAGLACAGITWHVTNSGCP